MTNPRRARTWRSTWPRVPLALAALAACAPVALAQGSAPGPTSAKVQLPKSTRLYVFDCGTIHAMDVTTYGFKPGEVPLRDFIVPCYLITHPKGTLMWDVGVIPDSALPAGGGPFTQGISTINQGLKPQLAAVGFTPAQITYLAMSHYHSDHTANANDFAGSTWLERQAERDAMFAEKPAGIIRQASFAALKNSKTIILKEDEYDVFGDGKVIIKSAPGHTPGHMVLYLKLKKSGPILVAGDLYHFPEERTLHRFPTFEYNKEQSAVSRAMIDAFLKKTGAQMWIEHDLATFEKLKKGPAFYE
jgi:glyoxylase-like metal-dependent hydrolase (beta-lactamase superfamily II)